VIGVFASIPDALSVALDFIESLPAKFMSLGSQLITGLAEGIAAGAGAVISAITGAVGGAISAAKSMLGIASPSKVFAGIGDNTAEGFAGGVEDSTDAAHQAMATMVSPDAALEQAQLSGDVSSVQSLQGLDAAAQAPAAQAAAPDAAGAAPGGSGGPAVHIENLTIQANDKAGGEEAAESFYELITQLIEGDAAQAAGA
jgi:hypothetical protein